METAEICDIDGRLRAVPFEPGFFGEPFEDGGGSSIATLATVPVATSTSAPQLGHGLVGSVSSDLHVMHFSMASSLAGLLVAESASADGSPEGVDGDRDQESG